MRETINNLITTLINQLSFIFDRFNWLSLVDLVLVASVFFVLLLLLRETQAIVLLRGALFLIVMVSLIAALGIFPAFSWLVKTTLPAILFAIPVIFAPEIRRALERLGRARLAKLGSENISSVITIVVNSVDRLSKRQHGALIVMERRDRLHEYSDTGVLLNAAVTPELLLQIFFPNTPLHDGAAIISNDLVVAASCVMPLSSSGILASSPERQGGLRHRAALGVSEVSDAIAIVVSEETGSVSIAHGGRMIRRLDIERLENILNAFYYPDTPQFGLQALFTRVVRQITGRNKKESK